MARPKCSKKDPKRLRSMEAIVRLVSRKTRTGALELGAGVCAGSNRLSNNSAEHPAPAARDCCKKRRRSIGAMRADLTEWDSSGAAICRKHSTISELPGNVLCKRLLDISGKGSPSYFRSIASPLLAGV